MSFFNRTVRFSITVTYGTLMLTFCASALAAYFCWEAHWFKLQGWYSVKWHTHLAPFVVLYLVLFAGIHVGIWRFSKAMTTALTTVSVLCALEILLLLFAPFPDRELLDQFRTDKDNFYHIRKPDGSYTLERPEFSYPRQANSLGFPDREWAVGKKATLRVLALGDSFTEGDGAPQDSTYPQLLQDLLNRKAGHAKYEVLNAGICGSDPVFNYRNLQDRLLHLKPDIVLQTISSHDLLKDLAVRGGFDRFGHDGLLNERPMPLWVCPALLSRIVRLTLMMFGIDESEPLGRSDGLLHELEKAQQQLVDRYDSLGAAHGFTTQFIILPLQWESETDRYMYDFGPLEQMIGRTGHVSCLNLMPCYQSHFTSSAHSYRHFYWDQDTHHNSRGYAMMADCIAAHLE
ncbi:MAG: hypothetical protein K9J06_01545 [Flavobacteriales bacterium]|nr:hypothetical protein [Flavobacteriales bacterium]